MPTSAEEGDMEAKTKRQKDKKTKRQKRERTPFLVTL
jgi:hypothetical protein